MKQKTLREDVHCARMEDVADATALGAGLSRARFFVPTGKCMICMGEKWETRKLLSGGKRNKRSLGSEKEALAADFLEKQGYHILEMNFRCRQGEIDIIAREGRYLVFAEVKYRADSRNGEPEEAVGIGKQQTIRRVAQYYLYRNRLSETIPCRFDVVGIKGNEIRVTRNAF